jgi:hypothetical protein
MGSGFIMCHVLLEVFVLKVLTMLCKSARRSAVSLTVGKASPKLELESLVFFPFVTKLDKMFLV